MRAPIKIQPVYSCVMLNHNDIMSNMRTLGNHTQESYDVVAVGGSSLVLHGIKDSTKDVDFVVVYGDTMRFEMAYKEHCDGGLIDVSVAGECFHTRLPSDYVGRSTYIDRFGQLTLRALSIPDVIITKATRSSERDLQDIRYCAIQVSADTVMERLRDYPELHNNEKVIGTIKRGLG